MKIFYNLVLAQAIQLVCMSVSGQNLKELDKKLSLLSTTSARFLNYDSREKIVNLSVEYGDIGYINESNANKLKDVEQVCLKFKNKEELIQMLQKVQHMHWVKYLNFYEYNLFNKSTITFDLPDEVSKLKNIKAIKFTGSKSMLNLGQSISKLKSIDSLQYLLFEYSTGKIPESIKEIKQLKGLFLSTEADTTLPSWIKNLTHLKELGIYYNRLNFKDFTDKISQHPSINFLYLKGINILDSSGGSRLNNIQQIYLLRGSVAHPNYLFSLFEKKSVLKILSSEQTKINRIPDGIQNLEQLQVLELMSCGDSLFINPLLGKLSSLKRLDLRNTNMSRLPDDLFSEMPKLEYLDLGYNKLTELPPSICSLKSLKHLAVNGNPLKQLPESFGKLKMLENLNLQACDLFELPRSFGTLKHLQELNLQYGYLKALPQSFGKLTELKSLKATSNEIQQLPTNFGELGNLVALELFDNKIKELPKGFTNLKKLESLNIGTNDLLSLPEEFGQLSNLKYLDLSNNALKKIPESFSLLRSIEHINLSNTDSSRRRAFKNSARTIYRNNKDVLPTKEISANNIHQLPQDLSNWKGLVSLYMGYNNKLNTLNVFSSLASIPSVGYTVSLEYCNIDTLPFNNWRQLKMANLALSGNKIKSIPQDIVNAPYLQKFSFAKNLLPKEPLNWNAYCEDRFQKLLLFKEWGFTKDSLPKNDSMVQALMNESSRNFFYNKNYAKTAEYYEQAQRINKALAESKLSIDVLGESYYHIGQYQKAVDYLNRAIHKDTLSQVRIMNFVIPSFTYRSKAYLQLKDTAAAADGYYALGKNFGYPTYLAEAALLYRSISDTQKTNESFNAAILQYKMQINDNRKDSNIVTLQKLSLLELLIASGNWEQANTWRIAFEQQHMDLQSENLYSYLNLCLLLLEGKIKNEAFLKNSEAIIAKKQQIKSWSYEFFSKAIQLMQIDSKKQKLILDLTMSLKNNS